MGFAKSGGEPIFNKQKWKKKMEEKGGGQGCRHEQWQGIDGIMYCRQCGMARMPEPWEDDGRDYSQVIVRSPAEKPEVSERKDGDVGGWSFPPRAECDDVDVVKPRVENGDTDF